MFETEPSRRPKLNLAKAATVLAVTAGIAFGLCTVGLVVGDRSGSVSDLFGKIGSACASIVMFCLIGLLLLGIIFIVQRLINHFRNKGDN